MAQAQILSKNQQTIFQIIEKAKGPLKAYSILYDVQKKGIKAPLQVYRALDKLVELGKIHKIESQNSFIVCNNSNCARNTAFTICNRCGDVKEVKNNKLFEDVNALAKKNRLNVTRYNLEFYVTCSSCKTN